MDVRVDTLAADSGSHPVSSSHTCKQHVVENYRHETVILADHVLVAAFVFHSERHPTHKLPGTAR